MEELQIIASSGFFAGDLASAESVSVEGLEEVLDSGSIGAWSLNGAFNDGIRFVAGVDFGSVSMLCAPASVDLGLEVLGNKVGKPNLKLFNLTFPF